MSGGKYADAVRCMPRGVNDPELDRSQRIYLPVLVPARHEGESPTLHVLVTTTKTAGEMFSGKFGQEIELSGTSVSKYNMHALLVSSKIRSAQR